jgi:hypothetical protein
LENQQYYPYFPIIDPYIDFVGSDHSLETRIIIAHRIQAICMQIYFVCTKQSNYPEYAASYSLFFKECEDSDDDERYQYFLDTIESKWIIAQDIIPNIQDCFEEFCVYIHSEALISNSLVFYIIHRIYIVCVEEIRGDLEVYEEPVIKTIKLLKALYLQRKAELHQQNTATLAL